MDINYIHGKPYLSRSTYTGTWRRADLYKLTGNYDLLFVVDHKDDSDLYHAWEPGKYNPSCPECWLGFAHSINEHNQNITGV